MKTLAKKSCSRTLMALAFSAGLAIPGLAATGNNLKPLTSVSVPLPPNLAEFVVNLPAAIQLGKALFWDMQVGSDGVQACASCHFQGGADVRFKNVVHPGPDGIFQTAGPGATLSAANFPVTSDDVVGSQGITNGNFQSLSGGAVDNFLAVPDPVFAVNGINQRQVTGRHAPSSINAVFNFRNFWDGRANNTFNGVNPAGPGDPQTAYVFKLINGVPTRVRIAIPNASLASQAVGPPNSPVEMAFAGRTFPDVGRKMLNLRPLAGQVVAPDDSVLGRLASPTTGLRTTYASLIQAAFDPKWWNHQGVVAGGYNLMEANFSLYFGLSVMLYESTLVSDQTPLDQFLNGNRSALSAKQQLGMQIFEGKGKCTTCHGGAELSQATLSQAGNDPLKGFFNTAVRPVAEDGGDILQPGQGKFKTPPLRNVELNGPYFHNGEAATLRQVVEFYNRGGNFRSEFTHSDVRVLNLSDAEKAALVDFMIGLTDERVRWEKAPFDHPSLNLPNGANLPATGAAGRTQQQGPLQPFLGLPPQQP